MFRTQDPLEAADGVTLGIASGYASGSKVDLDPRIRVQIRQYVVVARAAVEAVGAISALEPVVAAIADEGIGMCRPIDSLEPADGVALGMASRHAPGSKVHTHPRIRVPVRHDVEPGAAVETVGTRLAPEYVVAAIADKGIVMRRAIELLDADEGVVLGMAS